MNAWAIALISVGVLATLAVVAFIVMKRKKVSKKIIQKKRMRYAF